MTRKLKILHLEDLQADAEFVERELRKSDILFEKITVDNKADYVKALAEFFPDVILSDHSIPSFDSMQALNILKSAGMKTPFILVTATVSEDFAVSIMKEGAYDYVLKDRLQRLPNAVLNAIEKYDFEIDRQRFIDEVVTNESLMKEAEKLARFGSWQLNMENKMVALSDEVYEILGYEHIEVDLMLQTVLNRIHPEDRALITDTIDDVFINNLYLYKLDFRVIGKGNSEKFIRSELLIKRNEEGVPLRINGFFQDITEIKKSEDELRNLNEQLRELASHLQDIREEERASIAREIHDELGQQLTALKMDIYWLSKRISHDDEAIEQKIQEINILLDHTIKTVRKISTQLRPSILDDLGLIEAMEWQSQEFEKRSGIKINFAASEFITEAKDVAIAIFRIFQESLTNVARHANATGVTANLEQDNDQLVLTITDNGKGFDINSIGHKKTLGLLGMKERTLILGGKYEIISTPGSGTEVIISIPV